MRKMMMAIAALALSSGVAWGQGAGTQQITLFAEVNGHCTVGTAGTTLGGAVPSTAIAAGRVTGDQPFSMSGSSASIICTSKIKVSIHTLNKGLLSAATNVGTNFTNKIHYTAKATYNGTTATLDTADGALVNNTAISGLSDTASHTGVVAFDIKTQATPSDKYLVDGQYHDTITVTVAPST
jgi:hypothetical protein